MGSVSATIVSLGHAIRGSPTKRFSLKKGGTMLPCNVVVQEIGQDRTEIAAIDPVASMQAIDNPSLKKSAERVQVLLRQVIDGI